MTIKSNFYKLFFVPAAVTFILLLVPLIAMQFTEEVKWNFFDFIVAGFLLFGTGFSYKLLTQKAGSTVYKAAIAVSLASGLFLVWANLAVGIVGSEENPVNVFYFGVIAIGMIGSVIARFRPRGLSLTMFAMASATALIAAGIIIFAVFQNIEFTFPDVMRLLAIHVFFITLFVISALLFRQAEEK